MNRTNKFMACFLIFFWLLMIVSLSLAQEKQQEIIFCPKCGAKNPAVAKYCFQCGRELPAKVIQPEPLETKPPTPPEEPSVKPEPGEEIRPVPPEEALPVTSDELKAKAIYNYGVALFGSGAYKNAVAEFHKVVKEYSSTKYAEVALLMINACYKMEALEKETKSKKGGTSAFAQGFLGGCVSVATLILLVIVLAAVD